MEFLLSIFKWNFLFLRLDLPQLKLECLCCQKIDIRTNSPCSNVSPWASFCFLQGYQQIRVWMVSANGKRTLTRSTNLFCRKHPTLFLIKKRRSLNNAEGNNAEQLLYQTENSHQRFSIKMLFLNILQYSQEKTCVKFLGTPLLKNIFVWLLLN